MQVHASLVDTACEGSPRIDTNRGNERGEYRHPNCEWCANMLADGSNGSRNGENVRPMIAGLESDEVESRCDSQ